MSAVLHMTCELCMIFPLPLPVMVILAEKNLIYDFELGPYEHRVKAWFSR